MMRSIAARALSWGSWAVATLDSVFGDNYARAGFIMVLACFWYLVANRWEDA